MPLSSHQAGILRLIANHRGPTSHVAGGAVLNAAGRSFSDDIDIFHDTEVDVLTSAAADSEVLIRNGYEVAWVRRLPSIWTAVVRKDGEETRLDWALDSAFRFFPAERHPTFGYALHPADVATNKVLAAAGRREARDVVHLLQLHDAGLPLSAVVWAAVSKDPGYSPNSLIREVRRNAHHRQEDFSALESTEALDAAALLQRFRAALDEAEIFATRMPADRVGLLFLRDGRIVEPDPARLEEYETRAASKGGILPTPG